ncbi:MAG: WXG100 family type VII secretion target [Bifidobacteriaceae bacterium]|jgi:WXG100 family type VII secretion target|nr:WXG100 family type VII secretion target [Bifidobacteriaceae bacterium]
MGNYQVDSDLIAAATGGVRKSIGAIQAESAALMAQLNDLQGSWRGAAATAFAGVAAGWQATQVKVEAALDQINRALEVAGQNYAEAETGALAMFGLG